MRGRMLGGAVAAAILWTGTLWTGMAAASELCPLPVGMGAGTGSGAALPHTRAALASGGVLTVVAIGSSSTEGVGASQPSATYPAQLDSILEGRHPAARIDVMNRGIGGETAGANLTRFARDVLAARPTLVVWQVGTNDSFRDVPLAAFKDTVREGAALVRGAGADLILMNPQSFPAEGKVASYPAFASAVLDLGRELGAPVFDRYGIMKWWLESGRFSADSILSPDGLHLKDAGYRCMAELVADMIDGPQGATTASAR